MLKPQDIVVLLKLAGSGDDWTFSALAQQLGLSQSAVHRSLNRLAETGLYEGQSRNVNRFGLLEFLAHGARYVFPAVMRGEARGIPTAWAAPPLADRLSSSRQNVPVWPDAQGKVRGIALDPLHPTVPGAVSQDRNLHEALALVDAIRIGSIRERNLAIDELGKRLQATVPK